MLNFFGQKFKDNGYQLMNDRDAPIWQNPGYWPVTFRMIPLWHRVSTNKVATDQSPTGEQKITSTGFDLSGLDFHTGGTLEKNFSFYLLPSSDPTGAFHFESVMARIDNIGGSPWVNVKLGKFELDNLLSEKRILTLTGNGGIYQLYHFIPLGDGNIFGQMGDNQLGLEVMGHSSNDRTRYSVALISSNDGTTQLPYGEESYSTFITGSQAFDAGKLGRATPRLLRDGRRSPNNLAYQWRSADCRFGNVKQRLQSRGIRRPVLFWSACGCHGSHAAWLGQRLVRPRLWRLYRYPTGLCANNNIPAARQHSPRPAQRAKSDLEWRSRRTSLRSQSADDLDWAL